METTLWRTTLKEIITEADSFMDSGEGLLTIKNCNKHSSCISFLLLFQWITTNFSGLKQHQFIILQFWTSRNEKLSVDQNQKPRYWQSWLPLSALGGNPSPCLVQLLQLQSLAQGPFFHLQSQHLQISLSLLPLSHHLLLSPSYGHPYFYLRPNCISQNNLPLSKSSV